MAMTSDDVPRRVPGRVPGRVRVVEVAGGLELPPPGAGPAEVLTYGPQGGRVRDALAASAWAEAHPLAVAIAANPAGPLLAGGLSFVEVADVDDAALIETIAGWERVMAWAAARQAVAVAELVRRPRAGVDAVEGAVAEVSCALAVSRAAGQAVVERAVGLDAVPAVHDALSSGLLSARKADVLLRATDHLRGDDRARVVATVLDRVHGQAPGMTAPQLRAAVRRAEVEVDPAAAGRRYERARAERCVRMEPAPEGMAWIHAFLPAVDAMKVMTGLDALAAAAAPDDPRSVDQCRADALTDAVGRFLDAGVDLAGAPLVTRHGRRPHVQVTMGLGTALGRDERAAELAGYGPVPAGVARAVLDEATWAPVALHPVTGEVLGRADRGYRPSAWTRQAVLARDVTCTFPGCRVPAARADVDHVDPHRPDGPDDQTRLDNLQALCRHHHRLKTHGRWTPHRDPRTGTTTWTSPTGRTYTRPPIVPAGHDPHELPRRLPRPTVDADPPPLRRRRARTTRDDDDPPAERPDGAIPF